MINVLVLIAAFNVPLGITRRADAEIALRFDFLNELISVFIAPRLRERRAGWYIAAQRQDIGDVILFKRPYQFYDLFL
ncbi:hypothetical protein SDC9_188246 [bioreactor metagenome]|uniref:Uncharacterized protein n=1 Tax=bioreactor metagenome TaxID=1076179 RepID=A0A645HP30_9ZZZZ